MSIDDIETIEQRLSGVIGHTIIENAKLGWQCQVMQKQMQAESERANTLSVELAQTKQQLEAETKRADHVEQLNQVLSRSIESLRLEARSDVEEVMGSDQCL